MTRKNPVTPETRAQVLLADGQCAAVTLGHVHECRNQWGEPHNPDRLDFLTLDHVHDGYGMAGKRAPSDRAHLVSLCWSSHLLGWATANRPLLRGYIAERERRYLAQVNPEEGERAA